MKIQEKVNLSALTTFGIGGPARYLVWVKTKKELLGAVDFAKKEGLPIFVLGRGSDILVSEKGVKAVVIQLKNKEFVVKGNQVKLGAGLNWDGTVARIVNLGLGGVECLSGIPGTVGAAPVQNIGAYGQELADNFLSLEAFDITRGDFRRFTKKQCQFSYRDSLFKRNKGRYIIFSVTLKLRKNAKPTITYESLKKYFGQKDLARLTIQQVREAVLAVRKTKLEDPKKVGNAGSFFKNPVVSKRKFGVLLARYHQLPSFPDKTGVKLSAGWLVEQVGWKGKRYKSAQVSQIHALVLVNPGGARAADVRALATKIKRDVKRKFGIALEEEVQYVGFN